MQVIITRSYTCRVAQKVIVQSIYKQCKYNYPNGHNCAKHIQILIQLLHDLSLTKNGDPWTCFGGYF
jgi:hypothetical protein